MKLSKSRLNLLVDGMIGVGFLVEAISGYILAVVLPSSGYQGGRNLDRLESFIISRHSWLALHDWFAVVICLGVLVHIVLHWRWITCIVRNLFQEVVGRFSRSRSVHAEECQLPS